MDGGTIEFGRKVMGLAINDDGTFPDLEAKKAAGVVALPREMVDNGLGLPWPPPASILVSRVVTVDGVNRELVEYNNGDVRMITPGTPGRGEPFTSPASLRIASIDYGGHIHHDHLSRSRKIKDRPYHAMNRGRQLMAAWNKHRAAHRLDETGFTPVVVKALLMVGMMTVTPWFKPTSDPNFREIPDEMLDQLNYYRVMMVVHEHPELTSEDDARALMWACINR